MNLLAISGSPSARSRSAALLALAEQRLAAQTRLSTTLPLRDLPAAALLAADVHDSAIRQAITLVAAADVVLVATPIYKAAYSGLLKVFLDLLPQEALRGKTVLPLATGGSATHLLALDYALKPVLSALGARDILDGVFATDAQLPFTAEGVATAAPELSERLDRALAPLADGTRRYTAGPAARAAAPLQAVA